MEILMVLAALAVMFAAEWFLGEPPRAKRLYYNKHLDRYFWG